jgi:hypothetical protein
MENVAEQRRVTDAELADLQRRYDAEQTIYHQQNEDITNFQNNLNQLKAKQIDLIKKIRAGVTLTNAADDITELNMSIEIHNEALYEVQEDMKALSKHLAEYAYTAKMESAAAEASVQQFLATQTITSAKINKLEQDNVKLVQQVDEIPAEEYFIPQHLIAEAEEKPRMQKALHLCSIANRALLGSIQGTVQDQVERHKRDGVNKTRAKSANDPVAKETPASRLARMGRGIYHPGSHGGKASLQNTINLAEQYGMTPGEVIFRLLCYCLHLRLFCSSASASVKWYRTMAPSIRVSLRWIA